MKQKIAFAMIMGIITTGIVSFVLIYVNVGLKDTFFRLWLRSWGLGYMIAIPAILIIGPRVQKLVENLFGNKVAGNEFD